MFNTTRRNLLCSIAAAPAALAAVSRPAAAHGRFKISLAEWSLNAEIFSGKMTNLDFPGVTRRRYGLDAVEYVNQFFKDKATDTAYLNELKKRCDDAGVRSLLIMCDGEGNLGAATAGARSEAVEKHKRWVDAARHLGCHSIRVNAGGSGSPEEASDRVSEGCSQLTEYGKSMGISIIIENHGGLSSNPDWLVGVMKKVNSPYFGTLPDFGNFEKFNRYEAVRKLMPYAKGVSAKSHNFDANGNETQTDYFRMMEIVLSAGYQGYVGIEYEGRTHTADEGIRLTRELLERTREGRRGGL